MTTKASVARHPFAIRPLALHFLVFVCTGLAGCGGGSALPATAGGGAGHGGAAGKAGVAGSSGTAGSSGAAGSGGAAGNIGLAGNSGVAGQVGAGAIGGAGGSAAVCPPGQVRCGAVCVDPSTDAKYCGAAGDCSGVDAANSAGTSCAPGTVCNDGTCALSCQASLVKCGGTCIDPTSNSTHCGARDDCSGAAAGVTCAPGLVCTSGTCSLTCQTSLINCGGTCVDPGSSRDYCGAAGDCTASGGGNSPGTVCTAGQLCSDGVCTLSCQAGLVACFATCTDPSTDRDHCGASGDCTATGADNSPGARCPTGELCVAGACAVSCPAGSVDCNGVCVNPLTDNAHCGAAGDCTAVGSGNSAGTACGGGQMCSGGVCALSCQAGLVDCGGTCTDPSTSRTHCGATGNCGNAGAGNSAGALCSSGAICSAGACTLSCATPQLACSGSCIDVSASADNCGGCGQNCSDNNITHPTCSAYECNGACDPGYFDCDRDKLTNGCESDLTDPANCGACSVDDDHNCNQHATGGVCSGGTLCTGATCDAGYSSCDGDDMNGCELDTSHDLDHCGSCTNACGAGEICVASACQALTCAGPADISSSTPGYASVVASLPMDGTPGPVANLAVIPATIGSAVTAYNANGTGMAYVSGQLDQALSLDGIDDYVDMGASLGNFGTRDFSIALWFKTTPIGSPQWLLSKREVCEHSNFWNVGIGPGGNLIFEIDQDDSGTNYGSITTAATVIDGAWHHVAFARHGTAMAVYLDGDAAGTFTTAEPTNLSNTTDLQIGIIQCSSQRFRGQIDDVNIWVGYALSLSDERQIACAAGN